MDAERQRTVPVGYTLHNPLGVPLRILSATSKVVRVSMPAEYWIEVEIMERKAEIKLTTAARAA